MRWYWSVYRRVCMICSCCVSTRNRLAASTMSDQENLDGSSQNPIQYGYPPIHPDAPTRISDVTVVSDDNGMILAFMV